jgi:transposase
MKECSAEIVIGMDLSDKKSEICEMRRDNGEIIRRTEVANEAGMLTEFFGEYSVPGEVLIAMEAGTHSPWISALLSDMGFNVVIGNPRKLRFIYRSDNKSDRRDAEMLARIARFDIGLFYPITHKSRENQIAMALLKARDALIKNRANLINSVRGILKSLGCRTSPGSAPAFARKIAEEIPEEYRTVVHGSLEAIGRITESIKLYDRQLEELSREKHPETAILRQVGGVGPITALAFALAIEDPGRFRKSRHVACYLGLVPKRDQSGEIDKKLGITKAGNAYLRTLMVQCSQHIMGAFGKDCELRRFGKRIEERGGKAAKKRAVVAVARKLSILLHRLWTDNAEYDPFHNKKRKSRESA